MAFIITIPQTNINLIQGNELKTPIVVELSTNTTYESIVTKLQLMDVNNQPINFTDVFEQINVKNSQDEVVDNILTSVPNDSEVILKELYSLSENSSELYEIEFTVKEDHQSELKLVFETLDNDTSVSSSETINITIVDLETALIDYEEQVIKLSDLEIEELETQYRDLEAKRVLVHSAISSFNSDEDLKQQLMNRYWVAAGYQYSAYKLLLLHLSANNHLDFVGVKNVGGNYPYQLSFRDKFIIGEATQAIRFYPGGYKAEQTGNPLYPSDFPEDISSTVVVGQDKVLLGNDFIKGGKFIQLYKIDGVWYRLVFELDETTKSLTKVYNYEVSVDNHGDEFLTPTEIDMRDAISKVEFNGSLVESQDAELPLNFVTNLKHPTYSSNVRDSFTIDYLITSSVPFPIGSEVTVTANGLNLGTSLLKVDETSFYLSELGLAGVYQDQLNFRTGTDVLEFTFEGFKPGTIQLSARIIVGEEGEHKVSSSYYDFGLYTAETKLLDRRGALEHAVENTTLSLTGDVIQTIEETIELSLIANYPEFHAELDPELKVDTLFTFDKQLSVGSKIEVKLNEISVGTLEVTEEMEEKSKFWLSDIIGNIRPTLIDNSDSTVEYTVILSDFSSKIYSLDTKLITAKDNSFDIISARTTLDSVFTLLEVTDKSELISLINEAKQLLIDHVEGEEPGNTSAQAREALQLAIDDADVVLLDGDATLNDIKNQVEAMENAIATFKETVVKITINKVELLNAINTAQNLLDTVEVGINVGQTSQEAKDALQTVLDSAIDKYENLPDQISYFDTESTVQQEVDNATQELNEAVTTFEESIISDAEYVEARLTEYEQAAQDFYYNIRKKLSI